MKIHEKGYLLKIFRFPRSEKKMLEISDKGRH